ncbi:MAG: phenylalanine--tRNA ligase subunit alpha, partial [Ilumatobacteraceae bacterium]
MAGPRTPSLVADVHSARDAALKAIADSSDTAGLRKVAAELANKKSPLNAVRAQLGKVADAEEKKAVGRALSEASQAIEEALATAQAALETAEFAAQVANEKMDLTEYLTEPRRGTAHIVTQAMEQLEDVFVGLGFQVAEGPEVETDFFNFEALNMPASHPARSEFDTMFIEPFSDQHQANTVLLRTHTSPVQIRVMQSWKPPIYAIMPGRVFRRDTPDAT